jgi:hypothetical protein
MGFPSPIDLSRPYPTQRHSVRVLVYSDLSRKLSRGVLPRSVFREPIQLKGGLCRSWSCVHVLIIDLADEDVNTADRDDRAIGGVAPSRNAKLTVWGDGDVVGVENAPYCGGVVVACDGGSCPNLDPRRL